MPRRPDVQPPSRPTLPAIHLSRDHDRSVVAARRRDGSWVRVRPGASIDATALEGPEPGAVLVLARIAALADQLTPAAVISHASAAHLHGLPTRYTPTHTDVILPGRPRRLAHADVAAHHHRVEPGHVTTVEGVRVTTLERTVVDCAMSESGPGGLIVADAALHRDANLQICKQILSGMVGRRGVVRARAVLALADGGAESAGESLARAAVLAAGLPVPQTQVAVRTHLGTSWADLGWPEHRVLVEYDGRLKYAEAPLAVVLAEKRREDALLDAGWRLVRVTAEDLRDPDALARRVLRLLTGVRTDPRYLLAT